MVQNQSSRLIMNTQRQQPERVVQRNVERRHTIEHKQARRIKRMFTFPQQLNGEPLVDFDDGLYCPINFS
jgi:hypothetical protein